MKEQPFEFDVNGNPISYLIIARNTVSGTAIRRGLAVFYDHETPSESNIAVVRTTSGSLLLKRLPVTAGQVVIGRATHHCLDMHKLIYSSAGQNADNAHCCGSCALLQGGCKSNPCYFLNSGYQCTEQHLAVKAQACAKCTECSGFEKEGAA
jgi:hypothetical protein